MNDYSANLLKELNYELLKKLKDDETRHKKISKAFKYLADIIFLEILRRVLFLKKLTVHEGFVLQIFYS